MDWRGSRGAGTKGPGGGENRLLASFHADATMEEVGGSLGLGFVRIVNLRV